VPSHEHSYGQFPKLLTGELSLLAYANIYVQVYYFVCFSEQRPDCLVGSIFVYVLMVSVSFVNTSLHNCWEDPSPK